VCDRDGDAFWRKLLHVRAEELLDLRGILIRHETTAHLRHRLGWQHGLGAFASIAAQQPVHFTRRTHPDAFERSEAFLAAERRRAGLFAEMFIAERQLAYRVAGFLVPLPHLVVKALDGDVA